MNTKTQEEATGPLGVIGSLMAGFEVVSQHLWLIVLPMLLDLFLWLGPRVSIAPLSQGFIDFLKAQSVPDPTWVYQIEQTVILLEQTGEQLNLFSLFGAFPLLDVPSLLSQHIPGIVTPLGEPRILLVTSGLVLIVLMAILIPAGLMLGFLYMNSLARRVCAVRSFDEGDAKSSSGEIEGTDQVVRVSSGLGKFVNVCLFVAGLLMAGMLFIPLWTLLVGLVMMIAPPFGFLVWSLGVGLGGYLILHLLFVIPGVLLGERGLFQATVESFMLIQTRFPSVVTLILVAVVIYEGLGFVWALPSGDSWSLLVGILGNGCVATGLTAGTFVFYQEQVKLLPKLRQVSAET
ncbi:MAG: hypothetical protein GY832_37360 [Chloroflexi bacterium]|nr:hypothetical protein [Chloroflexota bacterium]